MCFSGAVSAQICSEGEPKDYTYLTIEGEMEMESRSSWLMHQISLASSLGDCWNILYVSGKDNACCYCCIRDSPTLINYTHYYRQLKTMRNDKSTLVVVYHRLVLPIGSYGSASIKNPATMNNDPLM